MQSTVPLQEVHTVVFLDVLDDKHNRSQRIIYGRSQKENIDAFLKVVHTDVPRVYT